jgi:asparagine synthase (glutamine-hydrolysing)
MASTGTRVILSGIGGDEITGGAPTPIPELADLFARAHFGKLARQLKRWALEKRKPWIHLFRETLERFLPVSLTSLPEFSRPAPWLEPAFVQRQWAALTGYEERLGLAGPLPSFQEFLSTLDAVRRQLGCTMLSAEPLSEKRYPFLDRDFLEFMAAVPREQLVRPGERRSLMRRALVGIVPEEILRRKRKAFVARGPRLRISAEWDRVGELAFDMISASLGMVNPAAFRETLERVRSGQPLSIVPVLRTIQVESWLRSVRTRSILEASRPEWSVKTPAAYEAVSTRPFSS